MDKATKERLNILAGVSTLEFFVRSKAMDMVESVSSIHPMLRLYFDSELNSDIEYNALLSFSESIIWSIEAFTAKGSMSKYRVIGVSIAQSLSKNLYFAKLIHHANIGRITADQFYELASAYIAAETVNVVNSLWDYVGTELPKYVCGGVQWILVSLGVDPQTTENIIGLIDSFTYVAYTYVKKFLTQEKIQELVYKALEFTLKSFRQLSIFIDKVIEKAEDFIQKVEDRIKSWGRTICKEFGWTVPDFLKEEKVIVLDDFNTLKEEKVIVLNDFNTLKEEKIVVLNDPNNELIISKESPYKLAPISASLGIDINMPDLDV